MASAVETICGNRECRVAENGKCIEGLELSACSHYGHEPQIDDDAAASAEVESGDGGLRLPGADTLTVEAASRILRARHARVIAIIGPKGSGKTSLIASLYDLFQEGPVAGLAYGRSDTLHAFELICHDARAASRRARPDMERTPLGDVRFYHLDLVGGAARDVLALLIGDRAGEDYRSASDDAANLPFFPEVTRADTVTVLVDGQRLLDAGARHNLKSEVVLILQALLDAGALRAGQRLVLVLTKKDAVDTSPHRDRATGDFDALVAQVGRIVDGTFSTISACSVAASPTTTALPRGAGVAEMLVSWTEPAERMCVALPRVAPADRVFARLPVLAGAEDADG